MATLTIRQKLITYLADAEDSKVNALYNLLEKDVEEKTAFILSNEHLSILEEERELHLNGLSRSYSREEANQIIKGDKTF